MPGELREFDLNEVAAWVMESSAYAEANRPRTIPTGLYRLTYRESQGQENADGQQWIRFTVGAERLVKEGPFAAAQGTIFFSATPLTYRRENGRLDKMTVLWGQLAKAFGLASEEASPKAIVDQFVAQSIQGFVTETLKNPEGGFENVGYDAAGGYDAPTLARLDAGFVPKNFVQNVGRIREEA